MAFFQKLNSICILVALGLSGFNFTPVAGQIVDGPDPVTRYSGRNDVSRPLSELAERGLANDIQPGGQALPAQHIPRSSESVTANRR